MLLGLRTVIYATPDLARGKQWWKDVFGIEPYFDEPFYVGYNVGGYELGLHPHEGSGGGDEATAYWGVKDLAAALAQVSTRGVKVIAPLQDVGEGIKVAVIADAFGNHVGLIENPHFGL